MLLETKPFYSFFCLDKTDLRSQIASHHFGSRPQNITFSIDYDPSTPTQLEILILVALTMKSLLNKNKEIEKQTALYKEMKLQEIKKQR